MYRKYQDVINYTSGTGMVPDSDSIMPSGSSAIIIKGSGKNKNEYYDNMVRQHTSEKKNIIPESQIALAVLYASADIHCNPNYTPKLKSTQSQSQSYKTLAPETQSEVSCSLTGSSDRTNEIPESLTSKEEAATHCKTQNKRQLWKFSVLLSREMNDKEFVL